MQCHRLAITLSFGILVSVSGCSMADHQGSGIRQASTAPKQALSPMMVQQVQGRLQQLGFYNGNVDGLWGPATEASVQGFQKSQSLNPTGQLDSQTIASLNLNGSSSSSTTAYQPAVPPLNPR